MSFKLLVVKDDWFIKRVNKPKEFEDLTKVINKAYSKARYRFDIIRTQRIKDPATFLEDFTIDDKTGFHMFILLGPEEIFDQLYQKDRFERDFNIPNGDLKDSYACDIPEKYFDLLHFDNESDLEITEVDDSFVFDEKISKRVLGTVGLKTHNTEMLINVGVKELLLTCFTSFMRKTAPILLETVIYKYLLNEKYIGLHEFLNFKTRKIILHADVIKEHGLVEYYSSKCGFTFSSEILIEVNKEGNLINNPLEKNILATRDFHISFIHREIPI